MGRSRALVYARIELQSLCLSLSNEVRAELNGAVLLSQDNYQLFEACWTISGNWGGGGEPL